MQQPLITEEMINTPFPGLTNHRLYRFKYWDATGIELEYTVLLPPDCDPRKTIDAHKLQQAAAIEAYDEAVTRCLRHDDGCNIHKLGTPEHKNGRGCDCPFGRLSGAISRLRAASE